MKPVQKENRRHGRRGQTLIEFALAGLFVLITIIGTVDVGRFLFTWNTLADGARAGMRYAETHGDNRTDCPTCSPDNPADGPSGSGDTGNVQDVVWRITSAAGLPNSAVSVTVSYPGGNSVNKTVAVTAQYSYTSLVPLIDLTRNISSTSEGTICF
jgi:hypothetical protein